MTELSSRTQQRLDRERGAIQVNWLLDPTANDAASFAVHVHDGPITSGVPGRPARHELSVLHEALPAYRDANAECEALSELEDRIGEALLGFTKVIGGTTVSLIAGALVDDLSRAVHRASMAFCDVHQLDDDVGALCELVTDAERRAASMSDAEREASVALAGAEAMARSVEISLAEYARELTPAQLANANRRARRKALKDEQTAEPVDA